MAITPLPPAPEISDSPAQFNSKAFAWVDALAQFTTEANAQASQVNADAINTSTNANNAEAASLASVAAANYKGEWSTLTGALNIPASVSHNGAVWVLKTNLANVATDEPGSGSPSAWLIVTLPSQSGNAGKFLTTNGDQTSWSNLSDDVEVGTLGYFATSTLSNYPSDKWLLCDGSTVSQETYPQLFSVLGLQPSFTTAGVSWTQRTTGIAGFVRAATFGNNLFLLGGGSGALSTSDNGVTWTSRTSGTTQDINSLTYHQSLYILAGNAGTLRTSTDAISWTGRTSGTTIAISALYSNGTTVAYGNDVGLVGKSTNGTSWTTVASGSSASITSIIFANNLWVIGYSTGGRFYTSTDLVTFFSRSAGASGCNGLAYGNGIFVACHSNGGISTSTNGTNWTYRGVISGATELKSVTYDRGLFVTVGTNGTIFTGTNGIEWAQRTSGTTIQFVSISVGNNLFFAGNDNGSAYTSPSSTYNISTQFALPVRKNNTSMLFQYDDKLYIKAK